MTILQMVDVPWDSGLAHYALLLARGLLRAGHRVWVSTIPGQKPWDKAARWGIPTVPHATWGSLPALRRFLLEEHVQVMNAHTGKTHSIAVAASAGLPVAVVRTRSDARAVRRTPGSRLLMGRTARIIAAAEYIRQDFLRTLRLPSDKVVTIPQGIDLDAYPVAALPGTPVAGILARLDPVKGHRYVIEALSLLADRYPALRVRMVGQDENISQRDLRVIAERLRVENRITMTGFRSDAVAAMAECSIGVIASTGSEAVSRVALEWMASGRPVVATRVGSLPEIVIDGDTGIIVPPKDAPALAGALADLLRDPSRAQRMGRAGRARVEAHFALPVVMQATLDVYARAWERLKR